MRNIMLKGELGWGGFKHREVGDMSMIAAFALRCTLGNEA